MRRHDVEGYILSNIIATILLWIVFVLISEGCVKRTTNIEIAPDAPTKSIEQPTAEKTDYTPQYFAPAAENQVNKVIVYFDFNSDNLKPEEATKLNHLLENTKLVKIDGYTCTIGTNEYNIGLGLARAEMVRQYLGRGETNSYGEEICRAACETIDEPNCAECRKVEVVIK